MEAFSLLKYWRAGAGTGNAGGSAVSAAASACAGQKKVTTIAASALRADSDSDDYSVDGEDDGPFFDLEFDSLDEDYLSRSKDTEANDRDCVDAEPSDELFFKGRFMNPMDSNASSLVLDRLLRKQRAAVLSDSLRKFRVFTMKGLKRPKSAATVTDVPTAAANKFFAVKVKVEEAPIVSLFTRDGSSRCKGGGDGPKQSFDESSGSTMSSVNKYLSKIKPLYVKVSRKSDGEKSKYSISPAKLAEKKATPVEVQKQTHLPNHVKGGLRVVRKHLGKSRSASSAVAAVPSPPPPHARRRDDSLLQQEDGIQSAIAHCKRSFNGTREVDSSLGRSKSDSFDERTSSSSVAEAEK